MADEQKRDERAAHIAHLVRTQWAPNATSEQDAAVTAQIEAAVAATGTGMEDKDDAEWADAALAQLKADKEPA